MSRMPVLVRDATRADAADLAELWRDLLDRPGAEGVGVPPEERAAEALARLAGAKDTRVLVAESEGRVIGGIFLRVALISPLHLDRALHASHLQVDHAYVRHGVGRALLESASTWADELGLETVLVAAPAGDRDANRFLARLGLAQVAVVRSGSVLSLRAKLSPVPATAARGAHRGRNVGQVVAARRSQRRARGRDATA